MSPRFAFLVVLTLMSAFLVYQAMTLRSIGREDYLSSALLAAGDAPVVNSKPGGMSLKDVARQNLFGKPYSNVAKVKEPGEKQQKSIPVTTLKLTLTAVLGSTDEKKASAFIENEKRVSSRYFVGDEVSAGVTLHAIEDESVILSRNGKLETLRYPAAASQPSVSVAAAPEKPVVTTASSADVNPLPRINNVQEGDYDENGKPSQSLRMRLKRMALEARRKKIRENQQQQSTQ